MTEKLSRWTIKLVGIISLIAFVLSYWSLVDVASRYSTLDWLAWLWPLVIDLPLIVFSLSALRAALLRQSAKLSWWLVGVYSFATLVFNLVHARTEFVWWAPWAVAAMAPVTLFLSFESLMRMVRQDIERQAGQPVSDTPKHAETKQTAIVPAGDIDLTTLGPQDRQPYLVQWLSEGMSKDDIAARFGKTVKTIDRDIGGLNGQNI